MNTWAEFAKTVPEHERLAGGKPKIREYLFVKLIDNGLMTTVVVLMILFAVAGVILECYARPSSSIFFDMTKVAFGVVLGLLREKRKQSAR